MNNSPLIQQALGDDWHNLPVAIQNYQIQQGKQTENIVTGTMHINYPAFVKPILIIVRMMGGLIDLKGENMSAHVEKWLRQELLVPYSGNAVSKHRMVNIQCLPREWSINKAMNLSNTSAAALNYI